MCASLCRTILFEVVFKYQAFTMTTIDSRSPCPIRPKRSFADDGEKLFKHKGSAAAHRSAKLHRLPMQYWDATLLLFRGSR
jgi:hypothetical protein